MKIKIIKLSIEMKMFIKDPCVYTKKTSCAIIKKFIMISTYSFDF